MTFTIRRLCVNSQQNIYLLNRIFSSSKLYPNRFHQLHTLRHTDLPQVGFYRFYALQFPYTLAYSSNQIVHTSVRFKSNKRNKRTNRNDSDEEDDEDSDDERKSNLDEFRDGDKSADRNLAEVKVQTLRLDTVIKAGLGFSKNKIEKLFYSSKIRLNGNKVTKKSMDIVKNCEIDVIKGPNEDNSNFIDVGRIEILSIRPEGLFFVLTMRRSKNLTIENYADAGRYTESE